MNRNKLLKYRDTAKFIVAVVLFFIYLPHCLILLRKRVRYKTFQDIRRMKIKLAIRLPDFLAFLYFIHNNRYYRTLYYHRIGPLFSLLIGWWRPGDRYFIISKSCEIGEGMLIAHPYATVLNAKKIGRNFSVIHLTTLGKIGDECPVIGDNVTLGANVTIIGGVTIGNNVSIGAGSVVVKDIPDNCVAVGNPAKVIKSCSNPHNKLN